MRKLIAAFVVLSVMSLAASSAKADDVRAWYYSSNGCSGSSYSSGTTTPGHWEYQAGGSTIDCRREPAVVFVPDPYSAGGTYRSSESWSRNSYSRSYEYRDSNGSYYRSESSSRGGYSSYYYRSGR